jgi:hypothetical protein
VSARKRTRQPRRHAIGFVFAPGDTRWPLTPVPRKPKADKDEGSDLDDWVWCGDRLMFVVGYTSGGAPYGCYADEMGPNIRLSS